MKAHKKVILLVGGRSTEFDASIHSYKAFRHELLENDAWLERIAGVLYVSRKGQPFFIPGNQLPDGESGLGNEECKLAWFEVFPILKKTDAYLFNLWHGNEGEDGALQGLAEILGLRGSFGSVFASSFTMNKWAQSMAIAYQMPDRLTIPATLIISHQEDLKDLKQWAEKEQISSVVVKPNNMGASLLTTRFNISEEKAIRALVEEILVYDTHALIQKYIEGREFTCGVIEEAGGPRSLGVIEAVTKNHFLGHAEKHCHHGVKAQFCSAADPLTLRIHELSVLLFRIIGLENMARFDFLYQVETNQIFFLEVNSIPGFGNGSAFPAMLRKAGLSRLDFLEICLNNDVSRLSRKKEFRYKIEH